MSPFLSKSSVPLTPKQSVVSITQSLRGMVQQLRTYQGQCGQAITQREAHIERLTTEITLHSDEHKQAGKIADNLDNLLGKAA